MFLFPEFYWPDNPGYQEEVLGVPDQTKHDVAIGELAREVAFSTGCVFSAVWPICLPPANKVHFSLHLF